MHGVVLLAIFVFAASRRAASPPGGRSLASLASSWRRRRGRRRSSPGTTTSRRGVVLAPRRALVLLARARRRRTRRGGPRSLVGAGARARRARRRRARTAVAKAQFLDWQTWDLYDAPRTRSASRYVWNSNYRGINFPKKGTTRAQVKAPTARASTGARRRSTRSPARLERGRSGPSVRPLDGRRDVAARTTRSAERGARPEEVDPSRRCTRRARATPPGRRRAPGRVRRRRRRRQFVLRAAAWPSSRGALPRGQRYTVWSYAPQPTPAQLATSPARVPERVSHDGRVPRGRRRTTRCRPFGTPDASDLAAATLLDDPRLRPYRAALPGAPSEVAATARERRTPRPWRSRPGSARAAASATTSSRRWCTAAAARRLRHAHARGLLPALRGRDGADAPLPRRPGARRRRLHERRLRRGRAEWRSPTTTRTPGSRSGSPATAGCRSTRRRGAGTRRLLLDLGVLRSARGETCSAHASARPRRLRLRRAQLAGPRPAAGGGAGAGGVVATVRGGGAGVAGLPGRCSRGRRLAAARWA